MQKQTNESSDSKHAIIETPTSLHNSTLLYKTLSVCPRCALIDRVGISLQPASVVYENENVWLVCQCGIHAPHYTLYCSSLDFFKRIHSFSIKEQPQLSGLKLVDMEDMLKKNQQKHYALVLELSVFVAGAFLTNEDIINEINRLKSLYPHPKKFVLKIVGKITSDIKTLNEKVLLATHQLKGYPILFEVSYERLVLISSLPDSAFLKFSVYPALKYFLKRGDEELCRKELEKLLMRLKEFKSIQAVITIAVERPFPDLATILSLLRSEFTLVRVVIISMERPPRDIVSSLVKQVEDEKKNFESFSGPSSVSTNEKYKTPTLPVINNLDLFDLVKHLDFCTKGTINSKDFLPVSVGSVMEPFLGYVGYSNLSIQPSPFCGVGACLVNTEKISSVSLTRLFDLEKFFFEIQPLLPQIGDGKIGFFMAQKIKKAIKACSPPGSPDFYDYFTDRSKADVTRKVIDDMQFLIIHNNMDIAAVDMVRRCHCSVQSTFKDEKIVASCTGCI